MVEPPPRDPGVPPDDETVVRRVDDTVVDPVDETYVEEEVVEEPPRKGPLIWPWLLALLVVVLGGLGAYWYFTKADEKPVPQVVGQTQQVAEANLREEGFEVDAAQQESAKPADVVIDQDPSAGTELEEGETVRITVSSGPAEGTVPDVRDDNRDDAVDAIEAAGFDAKITEIFSTKPEDTVVVQVPAAGSTAEEGSVVELGISKGGRPVAVPDVVGTTSSEATKTLREAGFGVNVVSVPSEKAAGTVVAQNPAPGATAKQGTSVRLNVAQAPGETTTTTTTTTTPAAQATVPDVVGDELADGAEAFADEGLKVDALYVPSDEPKGTILAQGKTAGTKLAAGSAVTVSISRGTQPPPPTQVPSVAGTDSDDARNRLEDAGFEVLALNLSGGDTSGTVESQTPQGGGSIPGGSLVLLYVGD